MYNEILYLFDHHLPQIKQVVFAQESYDLVEQFKMMEVNLINKISVSFQ